MDKKQLVPMIAMSLAVFAAWLGFEAWYDKHYPAPPPQAATLPADNKPAPSGGQVGPSTTGPATGPAATEISTTAPVMRAGLFPAPATQPSGGFSLGSARTDPQHPKEFVYALRLALNANGAGVDEVTLNEFPSAQETKAKQKPPYTFQTPLPAHPGTQVLATRTLVIDGTAVDLWSVPWTLVARDENAATFQLTVSDGSGDVARITKTYRIATRAASSQTSRGYEVTVEQTVANLRRNQPLKVHAIVNGPTPPPAEIEQGTDRAIVVGYTEPKKAINIAQHSASEFKADNPDKDFTKNGDNQHFAWAGQASTYFAAIVLPDPQDASQVSVHAEALDPTAEVEQRNLSMTFETPDMEIAAGKDAALPKLTVFFGPKWRDVLGNSYYASWPRAYDQILIIKSSMCGWCTFTPLIKALVALLGAFHFVFRDWGLSIICLVVLVRVILHPITKRSQVQMMRMGKLGPEVEKLKKKYADQPDVLNKEMMKVYKEQGLPMLGCLPMFLQTPIWIALWSALQSTFELRQAPFLFTWIRDLAKPDMLVNLVARVGHPIPLMFGWHLYAINILPLLMAVVTYINQKYFMPMPLAATPEQEQQQKIQRGMSLVFPLMFYSLPSGLNLYYLTSMSLGIIESKMVRDHIKQQEEAEKAGRVFVPMKPTRASRKMDARTPETPVKSTGLTGRLFGMLEKAQERAEQLRRENDKGKGKK